MDEFKKPIEMKLAPIAQKRPHRHEKHGDIRIDNYHWLRERDNPEVREYLEAENAYCRDVMSPVADFEERLYKEIKGRIKQTDMSVPYREGAYIYQRRYEDGKDYGIYCRQKIDNSGRQTNREEVILDTNELAVEHMYCDVAGLIISPDEQFLAYAIDVVGRREYSIRVRDLSRGKELSDVVSSVTPNMVWAPDGQTIYYAKHDPTTLRPFQILRHRLGSNAQDDRLVYEEPDPTFSCGVWRSRSKRFVFIGSFQTLTTEFRYIDSTKPDGSLEMFLARERGHEYQLDHYGDSFYVLTNFEAKNFRLMKASENERERDKWQEVIPHQDNVLIEDFALFREFVAVAERCDGLSRLHIKRWDETDEHHVTFEEPVYEVHIGANKVPETTTLRINYSSLTTPFSVYDYDIRTRERNFLKRDEVLGGFDESRYETRRIFALATDGTKIPISLVGRRDTKCDASAPVLLYGYGSYGINVSPTFHSSRLSLLDRGFIFAIAHVRGGEDLGRPWYEDGKLFNKKNTFTDFIACAEHLVSEKIADPKRVYAMGGSAGGLLMGAVINMRPDLFHGVIAQVPFVDVVTTMLDDTIPLTTGEYDEWGNPNEKKAYEYIRSYSPYDNVTSVKWPHLLVLTGLHDSQVQYWEPAKWVAKRRSLQGNDGRRLLLKTDMDAGHGGASGREKSYRELALQYAFLLDLTDLRARK